jgi:hypothetical protein
VEIREKTLCLVGSNWKTGQHMSTIINRLQGEIDEDGMISQNIYNIKPIQYKTILTVIKTDINKGVVSILE